MSLLTINRTSYVWLSKCAQVCASHTDRGVDLSEFTDQPQYPPIINNLTIKDRWLNKKNDWYKKIRNLPTIEQKMMEINMPHYWGYWCCQFNGNIYPVNGHKFVQYATRTHIESKLPENYYNFTRDDPNLYIGKLKESIEELIQFHYSTKLNRVTDAEGDDLEYFATKNFLIDLNRIFVATLGTENYHLKSASIDLEPRLEGFWHVGGIEPDSILKKRRARDYNAKHNIDEPVDRAMRSSCFPCLGIRNNNGLPEVVPFDDPLSTESEVPLANLDPRAYGFWFKHRHAVIIPGFWPGEKNEFGHLYFYSRHDLNHYLRHLGPEIFPNGLRQKALISGFTQAKAMAFYQGFTPMDILRYPFVTQSIITNGKMWSLSVYQLNTICLHMNNAIENEHNNICWLAPEMSLYDTIEDGKVKGLNEDLIGMLASMYLKEGVKRDHALGHVGNSKFLMGHDAPDVLREEFQKSLHYVLSERPRSRLKPEIFMWEYIFKIKVPSRPQDPPKRFFEPGCNYKPNHLKRLDDYHPRYIPKAVRIHPKIKFQPKINSEHLFKHDKLTIDNINLFADDVGAFKTLNIKEGEEIWGSK